MKIIIPKLSVASKNFLRQCGYAEISNWHKNNEISYIRTLNPGRFYPRFHIYIETNPKQIMLNLHLDAKQPSYEGTSAHGGEYDGEIVEAEASKKNPPLKNFNLKSNLNFLAFKKKNPGGKIYLDYKIKKPPRIESGRQIIIGFFYLGYIK